MQFGPVTVRNLLLLVSAAALGGAVVTATIAPPVHPVNGAVHQAAPLYIPPAPDQYNPAPVRPPSPAPIRLVVPSLRINAPVEALGVTQDYSLEAPAGISDVGWYRLGSSPGASGDAIVSGHRGYPGGIPAVFNEIGRLSSGDAIDVQLADGSTAHFLVSRVYTTPYRSIPAGFFATDGPPRLTLVTCTGDFDNHSLTYSDRLVVEALQSA